MSEQGLEVLDATYQKTQEWISTVAKVLHLDKADAYKALRAVLLTLRDRLPAEEAVHFGAQLPMLLRGLYYEGWKPLETPIKMSRDEFLQQFATALHHDDHEAGERLAQDRCRHDGQCRHDVGGEAAAHRTTHGTPDDRRARHHESDETDVLPHSAGSM